MDKAQPFLLGSLAGAALATAVYHFVSTRRAGSVAAGAAAVTAAAASPSLSTPAVGATPVMVVDSRAPTATAAASDELKLEQLSRNRQFFGDEAQDRIEKAFVVVVGVGGVGSHAAHMLARAGVRKLRLIDFDQVSLSSLNRHATACRAEVGTSKVKALASSLKRIVPWCELEPIQSIFDAAHAESLLSGSPDFVLDCIDDKDTKAALVSYCYDKGLKVLSSLGAGGKADPTSICITDLAYVRKEALGVTLRTVLRKNSACGLTPTTATDSMASLVPPTGIPCVYSMEQPRAKLLPLEMDAAAGEKPQDFGALPGFRVRVIPVLGTMPAMFGQTMAAYTLCALAGKEHELQGREWEGISPASVVKLQGVTSKWEQKCFSCPQSTLSSSDVVFLCDDIWKQRSAVSADRLGAKGISLVLHRLRPDLPLAPSNAVMLRDDQAEELLALCRQKLAEVEVEEEGEGEQGKQRAAGGAAAAAAAAAGPAAAEATVEARKQAAVKAALEELYGARVAGYILSKLERVKEEGWP